MLELAPAGFVLRLRKQRFWTTQPSNFNLALGDPLAYAITIHKSQGSEFQAVIIPVLGQHFNMLFRNLIYTGLTRAKKLAIFVGSRRAFAMAVGQIDNRKRQTALADLVSQ